MKSQKEKKNENYFKWFESDTWNLDHEYSLLNSGMALFTDLKKSNGKVSPIRIQKEKKTHSKNLKKWKISILSGL